MRFFTTLVIGLMAGVALGAVAILFNPLVGHVGEVPKGELLYYQSDAEQFVFTHGEAMPLGVRPGDIPPMWEATIKGTALSVFPLNDADGNPVALASRVSLLDEQTDFLVNGPRLHSVWLLSYPGKGTLFVEEQENVWQFMRDGVIPVWLLSRDWSGASEVLPTSGPAVEGARVVAGTAGFTGSQGVIRQRYRLEHFEAENVTWEAEIGLQLTAVTEQAEVVE